MAEHQSSGFLNFFRTHEVAALIFLNSDRFKSEENLANHAYHMTWHALDLYEDLITWKSMKKKAQKENKSLSEETKPFTCIHGVVLPKMEKQALYHRNMNADIFSASIQTLLGKQEAIKNLSTQRMKDTLSPQVGFVAEKNPFPICVETLDFLFTENIKTIKKQVHALPRAIKLTKETSQAFNTKSIKQWISFSRPAQEMAWSGHYPEAILGAAIYTSENTYVRSIADMVAENTDIIPDLVTTLDTYNPFTDQEANARLHNKKCKDVWQKHILSIRAPEDSKIFLEVAEQQNESLISGNPTGWCAYALIRVASKIENAGSEGINKAIEVAQETFDQETGAIKWDDLCRFSRMIFVYRREGRQIDVQTLINLCEKTPAYLPLKLALQTTSRQHEGNAHDAASKKKTENPKEYA